MWFIPVLLIIGLFFLLFISIRCLIGRRLLKEYKQDSLIIFGKKGHGKTTLMSEMTRMDDKENGSLSNVDFKRKKQSIINIKDISVYPNTWENVLKGNILPVAKHEDWESKPIYIDDAGLWLPNYADTSLKKEFPSMPLAFACWRHLYNASIHLNCQCHDRVWKLLREQADGFIEARFVRGIGPFRFIHCTYYKKASSAEQSLLPMKSHIFNKYNVAEMERYRAEHGEIKDFLIFAPTWRNKFDSRWLHKLFFAFDAPKREKRKRKSPHQPC